MTLARPSSRAFRYVLVKSRLLDTPLSFNAIAGVAPIMSMNLILPVKLDSMSCAFLSQTVYANLNSAGRDKLRKLTGKFAKIAKNHITWFQDHRICHQSIGCMRFAISG